MINESDLRSNYEPIVSLFDDRGQFSDLSGSDDISHTLLNTEIAELPAELPTAIGLWNRNRGPCATVPLLARSDVIYEEEPEFSDVTDEEEPRHLDIIDDQEPYYVNVIDEEELHDVDVIDREMPHLIEFNDEEELCGVERQLHGLVTSHAPQALWEDLDFEFWPINSAYASTQSALVLSPIPKPEFLSPESLPDKNPALPGKFAILNPYMTEDPKPFTTVFHDLQSDFEHHTPSFYVSPRKPLMHSNSMPTRAMGNADRLVPARSRSAEIKTNFASSRLQVEPGKLEGYEDNIEISSHCNAVDRFYSATRIVRTISQIVVPRDSLDCTQATSSHVGAQMSTSDCSTWTSAHSSLNTSLSLQTIQALLDGLPFEGLLTTATLSDKTFYSSAQSYCKTLQKLESEAEPRSRFKGGKMAESDQTRLMCRAYPELVCDCCSRKFGGQDRKRELVCHRKEEHGVTTDSFGLVDGECGGAGPSQQPKDILIGFDTTYKF
jgi:hypothetical protein